jgi:ribosome biogenesis GTPase
MTGLVLKSTGSSYRVAIGDTLTECRLGGRLRLEELRHTNPVSVGDHVIISEEEGDEKGLIIGVAERKNYLIRKATNLSKQTHIVAANLDQLVLVASYKQPRTSTGFIDRVLVTAEAYSIPAMVLFNKKDLLDAEEQDDVEYYTEVYNSVGYTSRLISANDAADVAWLKEQVIGKVSLFTGHSGVGKSTLMNAIDPSLTLRTGEISKKFSKGTHTTTFAEMLPLHEGGYVIDTPGIKEFGLHEMSKEEITDYFPELFALKQHCRFNNCLHMNEPGCAVLQALEENRIAAFRYQNYVNMLESNEA